MSRRRTSTPSQEQIDFLIAYGFQAYREYLAHVLGLSVEDVDYVRHTGAIKRRKKALGFVELFTLWHGRAPEEADWPAPRQVRKNSATHYEWQAPELALLANLVGQLGVPEICKVLTTRLRKVTGDRKAIRNRNAVLSRMNSIGLQTTDLVGGVSVKQAGKEIGSQHAVYQAIRSKALRTTRVGRLWCIPHAEWARWKGTRTLPPKGYVQLARFKQPLGIKSDKLSEFARAGQIPTAVRCNPHGLGIKSTKFGTWFIDAKVGRKLVADRRAGRPMPWHGQPNADNLKITYRLWQKRQHPVTCPTCRLIWGKAGAPKSFEDYGKRYPPLDHGAKRHLTRQWTPGLTVVDIMRQSSCSRRHVELAIQNGMLEAQEHEGRWYVTQTHATRWIARRCPSGQGRQSWMTIEAAADVYWFTQRELRGFIRRKLLQSREGDFGAQRGQLLVSKHQCRLLREQHGFTHAQAANRLKISVPRLRQLLEGAVWRSKGDKLPLEVVQTLGKRLKSKNGYTVPEAAKKVGKSVQWVRERIKDGTVKLVRASWDRRRTYLSEPMIQRLKTAARKKAGRKAALPGKDWLLLSQAALDAGVTISTIRKWEHAGDLLCRKTQQGMRYQRRRLRATARRYWRTARFLRAERPDWLLKSGANGRP